MRTKTGVAAEVGGNERLEQNPKIIRQVGSGTASGRIWDMVSMRV